MTVVDRGPGFPVVRRSDLNATSGRGLLLVESLADDWGVRPLPYGKATYFVLSVPPPQPGLPDGRRAPRSGGAP
ncbi:ATP-binding protein [Streptomyces cyaneofuscatus]|uniref:ATP-binding protein n=1 Tax=Streptomyces cyaneofuscatus TaxID=66883 RepID=UPI0033A71224